MDNIVFVSCRVQLESQPPSSNQLCNFGISDYACSSVSLPWMVHLNACLCKESWFSDCTNLSTSFKVTSSLSSDNLVTLLTCKAPSSMNRSTETWKLFFQKVAGVLEVALSAYSNKVSNTPAFWNRRWSAASELYIEMCPFAFTESQWPSAWVACSRCHWRGESQQLQRHTAKRCQLRYRLVPGKAETILASSLQRLPFLP